MVEVSARAHGLEKHLGEADQVRDRREAYHQRVVVGDRDANGVV